ncbi:MAG: nucleoside 2-deoxyribosyltransferase [Methanimicrococcus sp.]|nr:nucleoside 2-deoxyribosyltransferase [Methanimicrococcus sp.]
MVTVYLAGPLFSKAELDYNKTIQQMLLNMGFQVFFPQEDANDNETKRHDQHQSAIFQSCLHGLKKSDIVVAVLDGTDVDSGTAWELGYAYAENKPIIGIRTDFRIHTPNEKVNLMIQETLKAFVDNLDDLKKVMMGYLIL